MKRIVLFAVAVISLSAVFYSCDQDKDPGKFSQRERTIIEKSDSVMYVFTLDNKKDSLILRTPCQDFSKEELSSELFAELARKMLSTVNAPEQDGVGIAAPQVGILHRVVAVMRYDKPGRPFGIYPNAYVVENIGETVVGPEGCLSIPPYRGDVPRSESVIIRYTDPKSLEEVTERVDGYTAIIFQHEIDHLDGVLYIDRAERVYVNEAWEKEREEHRKEGKYSRPSWMK